MTRAVLWTLLFQLFTMNLAGQDTVFYFGSDGGSVGSISEANIMIRLNIKPSRTHIVKSFYRDENGAWKPKPVKKIKTLKNGVQIIKIRNKLFDPETIYRYYSEISPGLYSFREIEQDKVIREGKATRLIPLLLEDTVKEYYSSGQIRTSAFYHSNRLISNTNWLKDGSLYIDNIFYSADEIPEYSNGNAYFKKYILQGVKNSGIDLSEINDEVVIGWVITETGELTGVNLVKGRVRELNQLMLKLISDLPGNWAPATLNGEKIRYYMTIPFNFGQPNQYFDHLQINNIGQMDWN